MKPISFNKQTHVLAKDQPEYLPLPTRIKNGVNTSCWKLTMKERLHILFTGILWIDIYTFGNPQQPLRPFIKKEEML